MAQYKIKAFGITKDIVGSKETVVEIQGHTVEDLRKYLFERYPQLVDLRSLFMAVNHNYAEAEQVISDADEIALIPPVSGG